MAESKQNLAFETLVRPHFERLYKLAFRLTTQRAEAEDLFQELLVKAYGKLDELVEVRDPGQWLARVMYNLFIDEHRRFKRRRLQTVAEGELPGMGLADLAGDGDPVADQARFEALSRLDTALGKISEEHRIVVLLHDTEGYKLKEIQSITGIPVGTIKSRLHRARARLRELLEQDGTFR